MHHHHAVTVRKSGEARTSLSTATLCICMRARRQLPHQQSHDGHCWKVDNTYILNIECAMLVPHHAPIFPSGKSTYVRNLSNHIAIVRPMCNNEAGQSNKPNTNRCGSCVGRSAPEQILDNLEAPQHNFMGLEINLPRQLLHGMHVASMVNC